MKTILKVNIIILFLIILAAQIFILIYNGRLYADVDSAGSVEAGKISEEMPEVSETIKIIETTEAIEEVTKAIEIITEEPTETIETIETVENIENIEVYETSGLLSKNVPVLMYHTSSENNPGGLTELYVKPSEFEKQVQYLSENGFTFCTFDDYYNLNNIDKPIFLTFDDGYRENYTEIFPVLQKYNAKITLFLIISSIKESNLTKDMIIEMSGSGLVKFESHTNTHPSLIGASSNDELLTKELRDSKLAIEEITGKTVLALSYPNGEFNDIVKEKTQEFYSFGLRKDLGMHNTDYDSYEVRRIRINRSTSLETYKTLVG